MAKVTSKFQVTVPKTIAERYSLRPGDEIEWIPAGDAIRVVPGKMRTLSESPTARVRLFDRATERHRKRPGPRKQPSADRGWTREDLQHERLYGSVRAINAFLARRKSPRKSE
jgi:AbrB family looped-hinge helix DNA binding protein